MELGLGIRQLNLESAYLTPDFHSLILEIAQKTRGGGKHDYFFVF